MTYVYKWIRSKPSPIFEKKEVKHQVGTRQVERRKSMFNSERVIKEEPVYKTVLESIPTGEFSDTRIDIDDLAKRVTAACNELDVDGYEVVKISEIIDGRYSYHSDVARGGDGLVRGGFGFGYGYSMTGGVMIIGKKRCTA